MKIMFEKCDHFIRKHKKIIISNDDDRFKSDLVKVIEEIVEMIKEVKNEQDSLKIKIG